MIRLPAGTPKYLLLHTNEIARNVERRKAGTPVVVVVEVDAEHPAEKWLHKGHSLLTQGPVQVMYSQNDPLFRVRLAPGEEDANVYAAYFTTSEVLLAETPNEELSFEETAPADPPATEESSTTTTDTKKSKKG